MRCSCSAARRRPPAAPGFTLAEVVVAVVLLAWGALALVAASGNAVRLVGEAVSQERATLAARHRVERLAARGCSALETGTGSESTLGLRERWTVTPVRNGVSLVAESLDYADRGRNRQVVVHRLIVC